MKHVVMLSGGGSSWATARRVVQRHGRCNVTLLFADTRAEDDDLYRFLADVEDDLGIGITWVQDGRSPWDVFDAEHIIGNTRVAICSRVLKVEPCRRWLAANADPSDTTLYMGIGWWESHRLPAIVRNWSPFPVEAPLCDPPYPDKPQIAREMAEAGIREPALYRAGFEHNNCAGGCVRGGQAQWAHLLKVYPERYGDHERRENAFRERTGKDVAILRDRTGGDTKPLTLTALRERIQGQPHTIDMWEWGGCGCFTDEDEA